jgi:hypothetical protein
MRLKLGPSGGIPVSASAAQSLDRYRLVEPLRHCPATLRVPLGHRLPGGCIVATHPYDLAVRGCRKPKVRPFYQPSGLFPSIG